MWHELTETQTLPCLKVLNKQTCSLIFAPFNPYEPISHNNKQLIVPENQLETTILFTEYQCSLIVPSFMDLMMICFQIKIHT